MGLIINRSNHLHLGIKLSFALRIITIALTNRLRDYLRVRFRPPGSAGLLHIGAKFVCFAFDK